LLSLSIQRRPFFKETTKADQNQLWLMKYLDLAFTDPASNLACDEMLLEMVEADDCIDGILRVWQPETYFVVLGHSNRLSAEVNISACAVATVPILRRISGGGTILQGPGCLNYSLALNCEAHGIKNVMGAFRYVLDPHRQLIGKLMGTEICIDGISDLTSAGRKFSGNAQYRKSHAVLVHGTFLLNFDLSMIERCLQIPPKQPEYRFNRCHRDFVTNLNIEARCVLELLSECWNADGKLNDIPWERIDSLVRSRYGTADWTRKF
jgi:lipoate---protein ligase